MTTAPYRFLGDSMTLWLSDQPFALTSFGQKLELSDEQAVRCFQTNVPVIPEASFHDVGFSDDELRHYPNAFAQANAPDEFLKKKQAALQVLHDLREQHKEAA